MALVLFNPTNSRVSFRLFPGKPEGVVPPQWKQKKVMRAGIINVTIEPKSQLDIEARYGVTSLDGQSEVSMLRSKNHLQLIEHEDVVAPGYRGPAPQEENVEEDVLQEQAEPDVDVSPETEDEPEVLEDEEEAPVVPDAVPTPTEPIEEPPPAAADAAVSQTPNVCSCGFLAASPAGLKGHQRKCQVHQAAAASSSTPVT